MKQSLYAADRYDRDPRSGAALLMTVGARVGPRLSPDDVAADGCDLVDGAQALPERISASASLDSAILARSAIARAVLAHPALAAALDDVLPDGDPLLSRADLLQVDRSRNEQFLRARTHNVRPVEDVRALLGLIVMIRLGPGHSKIAVCEASRGLSDPISEAAPHARQRWFELAPWDSLMLAFPVAFTPGPGRWLSLAFVRGWIKPDVFMIDALGPELARTLPEHVRGWCGSGVKLPASIREFLDGEEAAAKGQLANIHGRGI